LSFEVLEVSLVRYAMCSWQAVLSVLSLCFSFCKWQNGRSVLPSLQCRYTS